MMIRLLATVLATPAAVGFALLLTGSGPAAACGSQVDTNLKGNNLHASVDARGSCQKSELFMRGDRGSIHLESDGMGTETAVYGLGSRKGHVDVWNDGGKAMVFIPICRGKRPQSIAIERGRERQVVVAGCR